MVRPATVEDLDVLVRMGQDFHGSTPYADELSSNPERFGAIGRRLIEDPAGVLFLRERAGCPVGMLGAMVFDHPLSGERTVGELFWWIDPKHRGDAGVRLLRTLEAWARDQGATRLQMIQPVWAEHVGRIYQTLGYKPIEVAWTKRL